MFNALYKVAKETNIIDLTPLHTIVGISLSPYTPILLPFIILNLV